MEHVEKSIEVEVPVNTAYNQWTQFEEFPRFMEGVQRVQQLDAKRLRWCVEIGGKVVEWDAEIFEQIPDRRIAWRSTTGELNSGMVNFEPLGPNRTRVSVKINYRPEGTLEKLGSALGVVSQRVERDLERFKDFIEDRGQETGSWRGQIEGKRIESSGRPGGLEDSRSKRQHASTQTPAPLRSSEVGSSS
jgi:uncharacterized membrane protein